MSLEVGGRARRDPVTAVLGHGAPACGPSGVEVVEERV